MCFQIVNKIEADPTDEEPGISRDSLNMAACSPGSPPDQYVDN
jgi:hypothetical protein